MTTGYEHRIWAGRLAMAQRGWITTMRLSRGTSAGEGFGMVWTQRWDWHGRRTDRVTFHSGTTLDLTYTPEARAANLAALGRVFERSAERALQGWDGFRDSIPQQGEGGVLMEEPVGTRIIFRESPRPADHHPTEALPADLCSWSASAGSGAATPLSLALDFLQQRGDYEDELTWLYSTPRGQDHDRRWSLRWQVVQREWHGVRVAYSPMKWSTEALHEGKIVQSLQDAEVGIRALEVTHYPGSPSGELPPGMRSFADHMLEHETTERAKEIRMFAQCGELDEPETLSYLLETWHKRWKGSNTLREVMPEPTQDYVEGALRQAHALEPQAPLSTMP